MTSAIIDSADFLLTSTRDDSVKKFDADGNKNLEYLPTKIGEKFPNLVRLNAASCSLRKIFKGNFKGLDMVFEIYLDYNQIEGIDDDTFDYLPSLEMVGLRELRD